MPMQTTSQILYDGNKNAIMQFTGVSDGSNETLALKVDCSAFSPVPKRVNVWEIWYEVSGGLVRLYWDALDPLEFLALAGMNDFEYCKSGGMVNGAGITADVTGNILLSTVGMDSGSSYSIKLELKKKF